MNEKKKQDLIDVKEALARKYERLTTISGSKPKKKTYSKRAVKYRRQIEQLRRA